MVTLYFTHLTAHWQGSPFWKFNEPYIIWDRLRLTLLHSVHALCVSWVKLFAVHEPVLFLLKQSGRAKTVLSHRLQQQGGLGGRRMECWIYMHESCQQGGSSSASVHARLRCNTFQSPMLKWDSSWVKFTGSVPQNSKVLLLASLHSSADTKPRSPSKERCWGGL